MHYLHYFGEADKLQWALYASIKVLVSHRLIQDPAVGDFALVTKKSSVKRALAKLRQTAHYVRISLVVFIYICMYVFMLCVFWFVFFNVFYGGWAYLNGRCYIYIYPEGCSLLAGPITY